MCVLSVVEIAQAQKHLMLVLAILRLAILKKGGKIVPHTVTKKIINYYMLNPYSLNNSKFIIKYTVMRTIVISFLSSPELAENIPFSLR